jgi:hypothetical protein
MSKHDEQRYQAFTQLSESTDDHDFLARLKAVYDSLGIAAGLDFAGIEQTWQQGGELPLEWRRELAKQTPFDLHPYHTWHTDKLVTRLHKTLFQGEGSAEWIARGERLLVLTAPLLPAHQLNQLLRLPDGWRVTAHEAACDGTLGTGLRQWAQQIAEGSGEWAPLTQWLREGGSEPDILQRELDAGLGPISADTLMEFSGARQLLLMVREQLLLGTASESTWIDLLWVHLNKLENSWHMRRLPAPLSVVHHCALPLLKVLKSNRRFTNLLRSGEQNYYLARLFDDLGMAALFVDTPAQFTQLLDGIADDVLKELRVSASFSALYPDYALQFEQQQYQRTGTVWARLNNPQSRDWYLSIIGSVRTWEFSFLLKQLQLSCDAQQLHEVILTHLCSRESQSYPDDLLEQLDNAEYLYSYLGGVNESFSKEVARRLYDLATVRQVADNQADDDDDEDEDEHPVVYAKHPQNWPVLFKASAAYPSLFVRTLRSYGHLRDDLARWELIWNGVEADERVRVAETFMQSMGRKLSKDPLFEMVERLYARDPQPWLDYIDGEYGRYLSGPIQAIGERDTPLLRLLPLVAARYLSDSSGWIGGGGSKARLDDSASAGVRRALQTHPDAYAELEEKARIKLLQVFDDATVLACAEALAKLFASSSKLLREPVVALIARLSPATIEAAGWLAAVPKARKLVLIGLALAPHSAFVELISGAFKDKAHDDYSRGLSLDALEREGQSLEGLDPWADISLATLQEQAVGLKIPAAVSKYWNDEFAAVLAPLGDALGLQLLHILFEGTEALPRRARQLLQHLPAGRRADLALLGAQQWVAANGAVEVDWMLLTLPQYGDERIAGELAKAIKDWKKARKQKASAAMRLLCQLPGNLGVSQARDLWESGKFSESIEAAAEAALTEAAEQRGMSLAEFLEQLVPDFGLTHQGLLLDVGPYSYTVRMRPDLSLTVLDEKGKASKSLPKAKAGEDADKRSLAENQFKLLSKNLKPVFKQQSKRLSRLFQLGNAWPTATWQKLFVEHPLMAVLAQSVVWSAEDAAGQPLKRFRPAEGGELIDLNDEPYNLPADAVVHATHPLELEEGERTAWAEHFADYKLESPIEQWSTPVLVPAADVLAAERLKLAENKVLNRGKFGSLVDKWGYIKGDAADGGRVYEHTWMLDGGRWLVTLNHGDIDVYFDADAKVTLQNIEVHQRGAEGFERQRLGDLPPAFLNTLLVQAQTLTEHAV